MCQNESSTESSVIAIFHAYDEQTMLRYAHVNDALWHY